MDYQKRCKLDIKVFSLDPPITNAGWSFAKLFLAGQFVEKLYSSHLDEIKRSKGKKFEDKFVSWLNGAFKKSNCQAQLKVASEMT
jgi:hypothetical protein